MKAYKVWGIMAVAIALNLLGFVALVLITRWIWVNF